MRVYPPGGDFGEFSDWAKELERQVCEEGEEAGRLLVDRSVNAAEFGWWSLTVFPTAADARSYRLAVQRQAVKSVAELDEQKRRASRTNEEPLQPAG